MNQLITAYRTGRILLHILCAFADHHWLWHWRGIARELSKA
jgi:hypothetical protein